MNKIKIEWSPNFAYAIGLLTTDGNLSKDGRHLNMTSKERVMILTFKRCLGLKNRIGRKGRGDNSKVKKYFQVQFGDKNFYNFLLSIGLSPAKSKKIGVLLIPDGYFSDFLRGCLDGNGNINYNKHPESKHLQLRLRICSASQPFLVWMKKSIATNTMIKSGWIEFRNKNNSCYYNLCYGKTDAIKLFNFMYYNNVENYLLRKYMIAKKFMRV